LHVIAWAQEKDVYLIAFLDDASTGIIHHDIITGQLASTPSTALERAVSKYAAPCVITSDNGGEFLGKQFCDVEKFYGIRTWKTKLYTPQQQSKLERFWWTSGDYRDGMFDIELINAIIWEYNEVWIHDAVGWTPVQA
jgi:transposase InsO family protein